jgi:uncharacterized protein YecE (DUF72 family)
MARLYVGTSGWNYPEWKVGFYAGVPRRRWLAHYAKRFAGVEVNATFYRSIRAETLTRWRDETPVAFRFAVKGHRVVTHIRRLEDTNHSIAQQMGDLEPILDKLSVVLWQTPARFQKNLDRLEAFARALDRRRGCATSSNSALLPGSITTPQPASPRTRWARRSRTPRPGRAGMP